MPFCAPAPQTQKKLEDIKAAAVAAGVPDLNLPINTVVKGALLCLQLARAAARSNLHVQPLPWAPLQVVEEPGWKRGWATFAMPCHGMAWNKGTAARHGMAWHGMAWRDMA